jgi:hypothetical protein
MSQMWTKLTSYFSRTKDNKLNDEPLFVFEDIEIDDDSSLLGKIKVTVTESVEVKTSYKSFFLTLAIGFMFICLSLIFLPLVAISPQKFLLLFSIGSIITISSFIFIYGTFEYLKMLFNKQRFIFTTIYILSLLLGVYATFVKDTYLLSLISVIIQFVTMIIFILSFIPGGRTGISFILSMLYSPISKLLGNK